MQIHEITLRRVDEGIGSAIGGMFGDPAAQAARAAGKMQAAGQGQSVPLPTIQQAIANVQKNPAQQQYIKGLVASWQKIAPVVAPAVSTPVVSRSSATTKSSLPSITFNGKLVTKGPDGMWHGETGATVQDPVQIAKIEKAYQDQELRNKQFQQTAIVKEAPAEYTTSGGIIVPGNAKTDTSKSAPTIDNSVYQTKFEEWAAKNLQTTEPTTRQTITLDDIKKTDIGDELSRALTQVVTTAGDAQKNSVAVNNYLTIAVAGVAREAQASRQDSRSGSRPISGNGILSQDVGLTAAQVDAMRRLAQDPFTRDTLIKSLGLQK